MLIFVTRDRCSIAASRFRAGRCGCGLSLVTRSRSSAARDILSQASRATWSVRLGSCDNSSSKMNIHHETVPCFKHDRSVGKCFDRHFADGGRKFGVMTLSDRRCSHEKSFVKLEVGATCPLSAVERTNKSVVLVPSIELGMHADKTTPGDYEVVLIQRRQRSYPLGRVGARGVMN